MTRASIERLACTARRHVQAALAAAVLLMGCSSYGVLQNQPMAKIASGGGYSLQTFAEKHNRQAGEMALVRAFPGGGTRAGETAELAAALRAGLAYVNVHTNLSPAGEIRGQINSGHHH